MHPRFAEVHRNPGPPSDAAAGAPAVRSASSHGDEAVSEVVGYLFIFGIVMAAISLIYVNALPALQRSQDQNYLANVDQSFRVLSFNANRIIAGNAPSQSVELKLKDSSLGIMKKTILNVSWANISEENQTSGDELLITAEHEFRGRKVAYEGGGIWVKSEDGSVGILSDPPWILSNTTTISYSTLATGNISRSGTGLTRMELLSSCRVLGQCAPTTLFYLNVSRLTLNITSEYCLGWQHYFERTWGFNNPAHFDGSVCGGNNRLIANVSAWLGGVNTTLYLTDVPLEGYLI